MNIEISAYPELIAAMSDADLVVLMGHARREEEDLMAQLHALHRTQAAFNAERNKRRASRRESLQRNG
ncbi:hypothetical protein ACEOHC_003846 [Salmonella enterica]